MSSTVNGFRFHTKRVTVFIWKIDDATKDTLENLINHEKAWTGANEVDKTAKTTILIHFNFYF